MATRRTSAQRTGTNRKKPSGRTPRRGRRTRASLGTIFVIFLLVAAVTAFFVFLPTVRKGGEGNQITMERPTASNPPAAEQDPAISVQRPSAQEQPVTAPPARTPAEPPAVPASEGPSPQIPPAEQTTQPVNPPPAANAGEASQPPAATPAERPAETRDRGIYFMQESGGGAELTLIRVNRSLPASGSPLYDALNALLAGPTADEQTRNIINLIPSNTRIVSVPTIRGNTAYIDFNEEFQYNPDGREGLTAQLKQIVWTATEFPNVHDVQILIEGQRVNFLSEGIMIGNPLRR